MTKTARDLSAAYHEAGHANHRVAIRKTPFGASPSSLMDSHGKLIGNLVAGIVKLDVGLIPPRAENYAVQALEGLVEF